MFYLVQLKDSYNNIYGDIKILDSEKDLQHYVYICTNLVSIRPLTFDEANILVNKVFTDIMSKISSVSDECSQQVSDLIDQLNFIIEKYAESYVEEE